MRLLERLLKVAVAVLAAAHGVVFIYLCARRLTYPYDLEWMEGGMLAHALRIGQGKPIYLPPSLDFVPFLYTPLYPALLALLGRVVGLGYVLGRVLSLASLVAALALGYRAARHAGADPVTAAAAMAALLAGFPFCGAWYDLVRNDELFLALAMAGLYVAVTRPTARGAVLAAALLSASYFAKQTGLGLMVAGLCVVALGNWRVAWVYALAAALLWVGGVALLDWRAQGWFWTWVYRAHARHPFYARRALLETPWTLIKQAPAVWAAGLVALAVAALRRRLSRLHVQWALAAAAGVGVACLGFGTQWAFYNAYIPGLYFPLVALAVLAGAGAVAGPGALRPWPITLALGVQLATHFYDPRPFCPTPADRAAGAALIARIAATPGDVLVSSHPWYPVLAGKPAFLHRMGMMDAPAAGLGRPRGLDEAVAGGRFSLIILDDKVSWGHWPTLSTRYCRAGTLRPGLDAPRVFSGAPTIPLWLFARRPEGARVLWAAGFRTTDPEIRHSMAEVTLSRPQVSFDLAGSRDERGCRVELFVDDRPVRSATGPGSDLPVRIDWDVRTLVGKRARLEVSDDTRSGHLAVEEVWEVE